LPGGSEDSLLAAIDTDGNLQPEKKLKELLSEADELTAIFTAGRRTSSRNQTSNSKPQT